jgi:CubicO group peptidase (beta-lactamase class C family)
MKAFNLLGTFFALVLWCHALPEEFGLTHDQVQDLSQVVEDVMACSDITGIAISIVTANSTIWEQGFGYSNLETHSRNTPDTKFAIASLSKAFTSALVASLIGKGTKFGDKR